jgi:hypothetical protein
MTFTKNPSSARLRKMETPRKPKFIMGILFGYKDRASDKGNTIFPGKDL